MVSEQKIIKHCGQDMKYAGFRMTTESVNMIKTDERYVCSNQGCKHEEIISSTRSDYNPDWLKDGAEIMKRQWKLVYEEAERLKPAWEHLHQRNLETEQLYEKLKNDIAEAEKERAKPLWQRILVLIRTQHREAA